MEEEEEEQKKKVVKKDNKKKKNKREKKEKEVEKEVKKEDGDESEDEQDEDHINMVLNTGRPLPRTEAPAVYETPAQLNARERAERKELREQKMLLSEFPNLRS